jgi:hypothetical protein
MGRGPVRVLGTAAAVVVVGSILAAISNGAGAAQDPIERVQVPLAAGDSLEVRFSAPFCGSHLKEGHVPKAFVASPFVVASYVIVDIESPVEIRVVTQDVDDNGRAGKPGRIKVEFVSVQATDGKTIPLKGSIERRGNGRGILAKIFTLFLIKGEDPCVSNDEVFCPKIAEDIDIHPIRTSAKAVHP